MGGITRPFQFPSEQKSLPNFYSLSYTNYTYIHKRNTLLPA